MANTKLRCICFLLAISYGLSDRFVGGRKESAVKRKGIIKTIEGKNGDEINCVDIYQQPAFNHPSLKNHIIEMKPSSTPNATKWEFYDGSKFQDLIDNEECPEGTIPIRHAGGDEDYSHRAIPLVPHRKNLNIIDNPTISHESAGIATILGTYLGGQGFINLWNPATNDGQVSTAKMSLVSVSKDDTIRAIEVGWMVNPRKGTEPTFFIRWTNDGYKKTGCYNLDCPGFVQVSKKFPLGSSLKPVSSYNGKQYELRVSIFKTPANGYWWLQVQDEYLGYWPGRDLFHDTAVFVTYVSWGGEIFDLDKRRQHTTTQMGSGHFPSEGFGKASYFRNIQVMNRTGDIIDPRLVQFATKPLCYDASLANDKNVGYGTHFYFGGPGLSEKCP